MTVPDDPRAGPEPGTDARAVAHGSPAIRTPRTGGFASPPRGRFAL